MQQYDKILSLIIVGAVIGLGKLLVSPVTLTIRLVAGRIFLGSGSSLVAGTLVMQIPDISPLALIGVGSALGIAGATAIEAWVKKRANMPTTGDDV